jgi:hypothetical protein
MDRIRVTSFSSEMMFEANQTSKLLVVVQFGECTLNCFHSEPGRSARHPLLAGETADSSRDTAALRDDNFDKYSSMHHHQIVLPAPQQARLGGG